MNQSRTLSIIYDYLEQAAKYCPAWTEYTGKGAEKKARQLEELASPLYNKYHTNLKYPAHDFKGSVLLLGSTGLALKHMAIELGEFMARVEFLQKEALPLTKGNQELHSWYKGLCQFKTKSLEEAFVEDFKQWQNSLKFEQQLKDVMLQLRSQKEICFNGLMEGEIK